MPSRSSLASIALVAVLLTAGCTGALEPTGGAAAQSASAEAKTITVVSSGEIETQPDQAVLRVAISADGDTAAAVRRQLADNASRMREALADAGIGAEAVTTTDYDIRSSDRYGPREEDVPPFRGRHSFQITLTDLDRTGSVIVTVVENGATSVDDVRFTLSSDRQRELRRDALSAAMDNARAEADVIAGSADLELEGVGSVRTADVGYRPVRVEAAAFAGDGGGGTTIEGGSVTVTARVEVAYNATAAPA